MRLSGAARQAWLETYIDLEALCINTAGMVDDKTIYDAAGVTRDDRERLRRLLADLFVFEALPARSRNWLSRLVKGPKRYLTDCSLVGDALRLDGRSVLRDGSPLGRMIDTFVSEQLRPESEVSPMRPRLFQTGRRPFGLDDRILDLPICSLWTDDSNVVNP